MLHVWLNRLFAHGKGRSIVHLCDQSWTPILFIFKASVKISLIFFFKRIESLDRWVLHSHIKIHSCYLSEVTASKINHTWTGQGSAGKNISPSSSKPEPEWLLKLHLELSICCQIFRWALSTQAVCRIVLLMHFLPVPKLGKIPIYLNYHQLSPFGSGAAKVQHLQGRTALIWVSSSSRVLVRTMLGSGEWAVVVYERSGNKCLLGIHTFHYSSVKFVYKYYALKLPLLL